MAKKFFHIEKHLRIGVGVESNSTNLLQDMPGIAEVHPCLQRNSQKAYLDLEQAEVYPTRIEVKVPKVLRKSQWGDILFSDNKAGARVLFGREEEVKPFGPDKEGGYVPLRLYKAGTPFEPVFVRVDEGPHTHFLRVDARWQNGTIVIDIDRKPKGIPYFLYFLKSS